MIDIEIIEHLKSLSTVSAAARALIISAGGSWGFAALLHPRAASPAGLPGLGAGSPVAFSQLQV